MLLNDIARYLQDSGVGTVGTDIFKSYLPDSPKSCVAVIDTGGPEQDADINHDLCTFQVIVRNTSYTTGDTKIQLIKDSLHRVQNRTIGTGFYYYILAISRGGHIGVNPKNGLDEWSINFRCRIQ